MEAAPFSISTDLYTQPEFRPIARWPGVWYTEVSTVSPVCRFWLRVLTFAQRAFWTKHGFPTWVRTAMKNYWRLVWLLCWILAAELVVGVVIVLWALLFDSPLEQPQAVAGPSARNEPQLSRALPTARLQNR